VRTKTTSQAEKVLDAAAQLFGTQRFHEVRMDDIAAQAAVGKGTLYRYFNDKEELYLALLARASDRLVQRLEEAVSRSADPSAALVAYIGAVLAYFDEQPHLFDLIQRAEVMRGTGSDFPWQKARDEGMRILLKIFADGKARGEFCLRDPDLAALLLLGGMRSVLRFGKQPRPRDLAQRIAANFLHGADAGSHSKKPIFEPPVKVNGGR
jgi:AcrR family transcriptional regulator